MSARSVPDELVQAAAEALRPLPVSLHGWRHRAADAALHAAFAKLHEQGYVVVLRGCNHEFYPECARCETLAHFQPWEASRG